MSLPQLTINRFILKLIHRNTMEKTKRNESEKEHCERCATRHFLNEDGLCGICEEGVNKCARCNKETIGNWRFYCNNCLGEDFKGWCKVVEEADPRDVEKALKGVKA
jgi:hypothetical protein